LDKIPSNRKIRLLFQPAEEIGEGAKKMVEDNCLEDVDEVYGIHVIPNFELGHLVCPD